jgi:hypothetical protein
MDLASDYDEKAATEEALRLSAHEASEVGIAGANIDLSALRMYECAHMHVTSAPLAKPAATM